MTDQTKQLFNAPWRIWGDGCQIDDNNGNEVAHTNDDLKNAARISLLPELYDALVDAALGRCWACSGIGSDILESGCPKKNDTTCYVAKWLELLRKVRDGQ